MSTIDGRPVTGEFARPSTAERRRHSRGRLTAV